MLVVNFHLPPEGSISTGATVIVNFSPSAWRIKNNVTNVGREFLTHHPQLSADDNQRIHINFESVGGEFFTCRK